MANNPVVCYFPGEFSPPNKFDLSIALWLSKKIHDISAVVIVLGKSKEGEISLEQKLEIWQSYLASSHNSRISIHKDEENSPLTSIYKMHEHSPESAFSIALPESIAKNESFQSHFEVFPRYQVYITPPYDKTTSDKMLSAAQEGDLKEFSKHTPANLSLTTKQDLMGLLKPEEPVEDNSVMSERYWKQAVQEMFLKYKY